MHHAEPTSYPTKMKNETNFLLGIVFLPDIFAEKSSVISSVAEPDPFVLGPP
jgi:hypothetical protein